MVFGKTTFAGEENTCYSLDEFKLFKKKELSKEELLIEAKKRYPIGTKYIPFNSVFELETTKEPKIVHGKAAKFYGIEVGIGYVYLAEGNRWAEIISSEVKVLDKFPETGCVNLPITLKFIDYFKKQGKTLLGIEGFKEHYLCWNETNYWYATKSSKVVFNHSDLYQFMSTEIKPLTVNDLIKGEIYFHKCTYSYIIEFSDLGFNNQIKGPHYIEIQYNNYSKNYANTTIDELRIATQEEKDWLNACIKANKFVSKEEALKKEVKFEQGCWYKINHCWYAKFMVIHGSGTYWRYSDIIDSKGKFDNIPGNLSGDWKSISMELLTDLSEIQQYLPDGHSDKINKMKKFSSNTYVVWTNDIGYYYNKLKSNKIYKINSCDGNHIKLNEDYIDSININYSYNKEIKWFSTLKEAESFIKPLIEEKLNVFEQYVRLLSTECYNYSCSYGDEEPVIGMIYEIDNGKSGENRLCLKHKSYKNVRDAITLVRPINGIDYKFVTKSDYENSINVELQNKDLVEYNIKNTYIPMVINKIKSVELQQNKLVIPNKLNIIKLV